VWAAPAGSPLAHARLRTRQPEQRQAPKSAGGLRRAIRARLVVELDYEDAGGARTRRALEPLSLLSLTQGWLLIGWCRLRRDFRTFRLDRMRALRVTDETFEDHPKRNLAAYFETRGMIAPREA
jgi:predicted DNA-binding transcriptional regulator YafY